MNEENRETGKNWYDRNYKLMLLIPIAVFAAALAYLFVFYNANGDIFKKDVSLTGGTTITVFNDSTDISIIKNALIGQFPDIDIRGISDIRTGKQTGFSVETQQSADVLKPALETELGYTLTVQDSSVEFSGSSLSSGFYLQLMNAVSVAFILMGVVVFVIFGESKRTKLIAIMISSVAVSILFRNVNFLSYAAVLVFIVSFLWYIAAREFKKSKYKYAEIGVLAVGGIILMQKHFISMLIPSIGKASDYFIIAPLMIILVAVYIVNSVPSIAVIFAAFADILMTAAVIDIIGLRISAAGIIAFLMLIGYSVDTDILLTSRTLRSREGTINHRILGAFKTGITMTIAAIAAIGASLIVIYSFSETLKQIFGIIIIGLGFDIMNTWITNASILKWFMEANHLP